MTVKELRTALNLQVLSEPDPDRAVTGGYAGDLLSWVMGRARSGDAWVTIMTNRNVVAVGALADVACVVIAEDSSVDDDLIVLAEEKDVNLYRSSETIFELCRNIGSLLGV
ncbi:MAG: hypothetical protein IIV79_00605 [Clostridia bacterium]|jgi:hypothetical protein|nr:hypothetical protein [Clostridia bacterium]MBQ5742676.1 hypothetical protein [Clostridia bacterium]